MRQPIPLGDEEYGEAAYLEPQSKLMLTVLGGIANHELMTTKYRANAAITRRQFDERMNE